MKTVNDFYKEIADSEALQIEFKTIKDGDALASFLSKYGCSASAKEFADFIQSQNEGEITDDAVKNAAGGFTPYFAPWR